MPTNKTEIQMENKLMMKLVIGTETVFFLSLILGYIYFYVRPGYDARSMGLLDLKTTGLFSLLLFSSSFTFWRAEYNFNKGNSRQLKIWLAATILLGLIFLVGQGKEYWSLLHHQLTISKDIFGTSFYTLTGIHGFHVAVGLILLSVVLWLALEGDFDKPGSTVISTAGLYWHFVDAVWLVVFSLIYVLPHLIH